MQKGYRVYAVVPEGEVFKSFVHHGIQTIPYRLVRSSVNPFIEIGTIYRLWKIFKAERFDIVHTFTIKPNIYGTIAARLAGIDCIINHVTGLGYVHTETGVKTWLLRPLVSFLYWFSFRISRTIVFQNQHDLAVLGRFLDKKKVFILKGTGVDVNYFSMDFFKAGAVESLRKKMGIPDNSIVITVIARLLRHKGLREFVDAAGIIAKKHGNAVFLCAGWKDEGNPSRLDDGFITAAQKNPAIRFLGKREDVRDILAVTDIYALPSYREGIPRTILEAMAMAKPVVTTDVPGCKDVVSDGVNGYLVPAAQAEPLALSLEKLIQDSSLRMHMGAAGRARVVSEFSDEVIIARLLKLYAQARCAARPVRRVRICIMATVPVSICTFYGRQIDFLTERGFDVTVITSEDRKFKDKIPKTADVIAVPFTRKITPLKDIVSFCKVLRIMRKKRFDIVQYSSPKAALIGSIASCMCAVPVRLYLMWGIYYVTQRGVLRALLKSMERLICGLSTSVAPDSRGNADFAISERLVRKDKIKVVGMGSANGVDLLRFDPRRLADFRLKIRRVYRIPQEALVLGFVGRMRRDKGINELVESFEKLRHEFSDLYLFIIGPQEIPRRELKEHVFASLKNNTSIICSGYKENPEEYLTAMDIFVLPSYREGFGLVNLEASAMALPVVSTDIPGPRDAVIDGKTGFLVSVRSVEELASAIRTLLRDKGLRSRMGEAGRMWAESFDQQKHWPNIYEHKRRLLEETKMYSIDTITGNVYAYQ